MPSISSCILALQSIYLGKYFAVYLGDIVEPPYLRLSCVDDSLRSEDTGGNAMLPPDACSDPSLSIVSGPSQSDFVNKVEHNNERGYNAQVLFKFHVYSSSSNAFLEDVRGRREAKEQVALQIVGESQTFRSCEGRVRSRAFDSQPTS